MGRRREGQQAARAARQRWLAGTAELLYARAYALYAARRSAGVACQLCGHAGARDAIGDHRLVEGPHRGTCGVRCYARRVDVDYRIAALGLDGVWQPYRSDATRRAVSRRLFALVEAHEAVTDAPGGAPEPSPATATAWPVTGRWPCCGPPGATALHETPALAENPTRAPIAPGTTAAAATNEHVDRRHMDMDEQQNDVIFQVTKGDLALFLERRGIEPQDEWFAYVHEARRAISADGRLSALLQEAFEAALGRVRGEVARDRA